MQLVVVVTSLLGPLLHCSGMALPPCAAQQDCSPVNQPGSNTASNFHSAVPSAQRLEQNKRTRLSNISPLSGVPSCAGRRPGAGTTAGTTA